MKHTFQQGQALVTLLFFLIVMIMVTGGAVIVLINISLGTSKYELGTQAYYVAEAGVEDALIRFLRDPSYTTSNLTLDTGTAIATKSGSGPYTITSTGRSGNFQRKVQVVVDDSNNVLTIQSWNEVP